MKLSAFWQNVVPFVENRIKLTESTTNKKLGESARCFFDQEGTFPPSAQSDSSRSSKKVPNRYVPRERWTDVLLVMQYCDWLSSEVRGWQARWLSVTHAPWKLLTSEIFETWWVQFCSWQNFLQSTCICCGLNLSLVKNFSNQFDFDFSLSHIHYHNLKQREIKIKLV